MIKILKSNININMNRMKNLVVHNKKPVKIGSSTLVVIPKMWAELMDLNPDDKLYLELMDSSILIKKEVRNEIG